MTNRVVVSIAALCGAIAFLAVLGIDLFQSSENVTGAFNVSPFVVMLGIGFMSLKAIAAAVVVGIVSFLVLGLFQVASRTESQDKK
jgi:hypothetical protein